MLKFDRELAIHMCNAGRKGRVIISCSKDFVTKHIFNKELFQELLTNPGEWTKEQGWEFQYKGNQVIFNNELSEDECQFIEMPANEVFNFKMEL